MKKRPSKNMETQFLAFMESSNDIFENLSDGAYEQAMQNAIDGENGWNDQNNDDIDGYEGFMFWVKKTWKKEN